MTSQELKRWLKGSGYTKSTAHELFGVTRMTFYRWLNAKVNIPESTRIIIDLRNQLKKIGDQ